MFSGIGAKITAALTVLSGILFFWAKSERAAKKKAQHKVKIHDEINEIEEAQEVAEVEVMQDEQRRIKENVQKKRIESELRRDIAKGL